MRRMVFSALVVALLGACGHMATNSDPGPAADEAVAPAVVTVDSITAVAAVTAIDKATRMVTIKTPDGQAKTIKAGPEVRNFDQIQVGDQVQLTFVEELAVSVENSGAPSAAGVTQTVMLTPKGAKPGAVAANTLVINAKIQAVDTGNRTVTFVGADGGTKTFKVGPNVSLENLKSGDDIVLRYTEAVAIEVVKPQ